MRKPFTIAIVTLAAGTLFFPDARAQQTTPPAATPAPAAKPAQTPSTTTPAAKPPAAKIGQTTAAKKPAVPFTLKTPKDKTSYAIGVNVGKNLHKDSIDIDPAILLRGIKDALADGKLLLTEDEYKTVMVALQMDLRKKQAEEAKKQNEQMQIVSEKNKQEGEAFLAANKTQDGVVTLPSGLQYKILTQGTGPKPAATDTVTCNYRGTLLNNTEFDSSYKRSQPLTIAVNGVIKGWTEALQLMPVGSKWQLFIPSDLAYGQRAPAEIGPNATLVFEVELLSIQPKPEAAAAPATAAPPATPPATPAPATAPSAPAPAPASAPPIAPAPKPVAPPTPPTPPPVKPN
jgi:FKBP-type peptidyl-prolyl cis-trans isomerase FklB